MTEGHPIDKNARCSIGTTLQIKGKVLALTVGIPGSGKTTWALAAGFEAVVCLDDCRRELWNDSAVQDGPGGITALLQLQEKKIRAVMEQGLSIVVHNTHHLKAYRRELIDLAREYGYIVQIVYFDVDSEECRRRNQERPNPVPEEIMDMFLVEFEIPDPLEADRFIRFSEL